MLQLRQLVEAGGVESILFKRRGETRYAGEHGRSKTTRRAGPRFSLVAPLTAQAAPHRPLRTTSHGVANLQAAISNAFDHTWLAPQRSPVCSAPSPCLVVVLGVTDCARCVWLGSRAARLLMRPSSDTVSIRGSTPLDSLAAPHFVAPVHREVVGLLAEGSGEVGMS
jgi:hypothetical protein